MSDDICEGGPEWPSRLPGDVVVEERLGAAITTVTELEAPRSTSYSLRRLALDLADGRTIDVLLKNFDESPHPPDFALGRGARERHVYEKILAGRELGTPELYGAVWDDHSARHWLLLEFVHGRTLRESPIEDWIAAACWLGRLHGRIAGQEAEIAQPGVLIDYDHAYFRDMAERALQAVGSRSGSLERRLEAALAGYEVIIEALCAPTPTLVHGSYRPENVVIDPCSFPVRICPVDWEQAAFGPPLHDLACMSDELHPPMIQQLCKAYAEAASAFDVAVTDAEAIAEEVERLRLHRVLRSLARSAQWAYPDSAVEVSVAKAESIRRGLR